MDWHYDIMAKVARAAAADQTSTNTPRLLYPVVLITGSTAVRTHSVGDHHQDDNLQDPAQGQALGGKAQEHGDGGGTCSAGSSDRQVQGSRSKKRVVG